MTQAQVPQLPNCPVVVRVLSSPMRWQPHSTAPTPPSLVWTIGQMRPDGYAAEIVRLFVSDDGVEAYYRGSGGSFGRVLIPWADVHGVEEMMTEEVFAQELAAAQDAAQADDEDDDDEEPDGPPARPTAQKQSGAHA